MATKTLTVVRPGTYGTRMLKAGDPFDANGPEARLYTKLGWMTEGAAKAAAAPAPKPVTAAPKAAPKKPAARKAPAKRKATRKAKK